MHVLWVAAVGNVEVNGQRGDGRPGLGKEIIDGFPVAGGCEIAGLCLAGTTPRPRGRREGHKAETVGHWSTCGHGLR